MPKRFRFLGHPLHPAMVHFPMGLLPLSFVWDLISLWRGSITWELLAFWTLTAGLVALLPALATGILDFLAIPDERKAAITTAYWHMSIMILAATFFAVSLFLRMDSMTFHSTPLIALVLSALGSITLMGGGYLGGKLVYQHGVGLEEQKKLNQP